MPAGQYGLCFGYLVSGPLPLHSLKDRSPLWGHFWESLFFRLHPILARPISALKLSVTTTCYKMAINFKLSNFSVMQQSIVLGSIPGNSFERVWTNTHNGVILIIFLRILDEIFLHSRKKSQYFVRSSDIPPKPK